MSTEVLEESVASTGAVLMGRRMFSGGAGPWDADPNADGWWGDDPPFHVPVFVLAHHPRETVTKQGDTSFTFVTDGIEAALEQARAAAGDKDVAIAGGARRRPAVPRGRAGRRRSRSTSPRSFLGDGVRLFDQLGAKPDRSRSRGSSRLPSVTHLNYRVVK